MSYFNYTNLGFPTQLFSSNAPYNSPSFFSPPTVHQNEVNYQHDNSFGFLDQGYEPENSHQYFGNGFQPNEDENQVIFYPVVNQVYIPESHLYKVVYAVEHFGTTYFYECLIDFPVLNLWNITTYTAAYVVDENPFDSYSSGENIPTQNEEQYYEDSSEYDNLPSSVEPLPAENGISLYPSMDINSFSSPELDLYASHYHNYWYATYNQSQCDIVENYETNTNSVIIQGNAMQSTDVHQDVYSENIVTRSEANVYYQQVNYDCSQFRNGMNLEGGSDQELIQAPAVSLENLDKNAAEADIKYRKDCIYLTALSGKLYQKQSIPIVERMPLITEVEEEYPIEDSRDEVIENPSQENSAVHANTFTRYSKTLCSKKSIRVVQRLRELKNYDNKDNVKDLSNGKSSKTTQQIDLSVPEKFFTKRCKKMYRKESILCVKNTRIIKEVSNNVTNSCENNLSKAMESYSVVEKKLVANKTEPLIRQERKENVEKMPLIEEANGEVGVVQSSNINIAEMRHSTVQTNMVIGRSKNFNKKEKPQDHDGPVKNKENIEDNLLTHEKGLLNETIDIPLAENRNARNLSDSMHVVKSSVVNKELSSSGKCQEIQQDDDIWYEIDLNVPLENTLTVPLSDEVDLKESLETVTAVESENESTKVRSQKPKKKRFQNFRKFLERLLCCCTKGPT